MPLGVRSDAAHELCSERSHHVAPGVPIDSERRHAGHNASEEQRVKYATRSEQNERQTMARRDEQGTVRGDVVGEDVCCQQKQQKFLVRSWRRRRRLLRWRKARCEARACSTGSHTTGAHSAIPVHCHAIPNPDPASLGRPHGEGRAAMKRATGNAQKTFYVEYYSLFCANSD